MLYDYDPVLAKQMLSDAGYPDGLSIEFWTTSTPAALDYVALLKDMWAKIGVEVDIKPHESIAHTTTIRAGTFIDVTGDGPKVRNLIPFPYVHGRMGEWFNMALWSNAEFDALADKLMQFIDVPE